MNEYQKLRKEAIKAAIELTNAILEKDSNLIELYNYKLNHYIDDMLQKLLSESNGSKEQVEVKAIVSGTKRS